MKEVLKVPSHCHRLKAENCVTGEVGYICDGCRERCRGLRYSCRDCNYDMHNLCATASPSIRHPLSDAKMKLYSSPGVNESYRCSACKRSVLGMLYRGAASGDILHPVCAKLLQKTLTVDSYTVRLSESLSADPCSLCGKRSWGWAYVSTEYSIHVHCLKGAVEKTPGRGLPQLSGGCHQLTAPKYHQKSQAGHAATGALQKYKPNRSQGWFKGFCKITKLLVITVYALLSGDPSCLCQEVFTFL